MAEPRTDLLPPYGNLWRTQELLDLGISKRAITALAAKGTLLRLRQGCYIRGSFWERQSPRTRGLQLIHAHAHGTRTTSTGTFRYTHTSGARLHGLHLWNVDNKNPLDATHPAVKGPPWPGCGLPYRTGATG